MTEDSLGLAESVSIALGGMIGGGIFAVLGVVAQITRAATWAAFLVAGVVAMSAGYAFVTLNEATEGQGGAVTFVQATTGNQTAAGMMGWTLLFGYVGSMAMYAYAFGSFAVGLNVIPASVAAVPMRPVISVGAVVGFVALNLAGARATGTVENALVGTKIAILLAFGLGGLVFGGTRGQLVLGVERVLSTGPVVAAGVSFVAFQGWQLLFYDQESIVDPRNTIPKAVYLSIASAVGLYVIVAVTTVSLAPLSIIETHPERALAVAADPFIPHGFVLISIAALFSTGSAINATLFSSGYFTKAMLSDNLVPDHLGDARAEGLPVRAVAVIGVTVAAFTAIGSLSAITTFASVTFILVFGLVSFLAIRYAAESVHARVMSGVGFVGSVGFFVLMVRHLFLAERATFYVVVLLGGATVLLEAMYFEREVLVEEVRTLESLLEDPISSDK